MSAQLPARIPATPHFAPRYTPWQQRLCLAPDGDFFRALREHESANVVTGLIDTVTEDGVRMQAGSNVEFVEADAIVASTGLLMKMGGDIEVSVDGERVDWAGRLLWHGSMVQDVPNLMFMVGYIDNSWTLGADSTAHSKFCFFSSFPSFHCFASFLAPQLLSLDRGLRKGREDSVEFDPIYKTGLSLSLTRYFPQYSPDSLNTCNQRGSAPQCPEFRQREPTATSGSGS